MAKRPETPPDTTDKPLGLELLRIFGEPLNGIGGEGTLDLSVPKPILAPSVSLSFDEPAAIISDVHGNLDALLAVLDDIQRRGIKHIVSLGDNIGYGLRTCEVLDVLIEQNIPSLLGNHEVYALNNKIDPSLFDPDAQESIPRTRQAIKDSEKRDIYYSFLRNLQSSLLLQVGGKMFYAYHGHPKPPHIEMYIMPPIDECLREGETVIDLKIEILFVLEKLSKDILVGHTHRQGVIYTDSKIRGIMDRIKFQTDKKYTLRDQGAIINPGSVGFPRDGSQLAAYAVIYPDHVELNRVPYDIEKAAQELRQANLGNLAERLLRGI